ncbi:hypothetical protein POV27_03480 [Aureisphaera galaxeae]|uniref:hypothetical protein n=1 Tax=Aureisphaera galaxeae TaxID=1538023 RepID=UPI00234FFE29|nr:hypothetical protein [Aureisphaera galaxeae]MDC8003095.1 hypothetical protein [Aureisphaera galaxeae]
MEKTHDVIIDFNNLSGPLKPLAKSQISIKGKRKLWGIPRPVNIKKYHSLYIDNLKIPDFLKVSHKDKLIVLTIHQSSKGSIETVKGHKIEDFKVNQFEFPFEVSLNPSIIQDCLDINVDEVVIEFEVKHQRKAKDKPKVVKEYQATLNLKKALCKPIDHFYFTIPELESGYEYHLAKQLHIGNREIMYKAPVFYAETYDVCHLKSKLKGFDNTVYLANEATFITESNPSSNGIPLKEEGEETASDLLLEFTDESISLKNLNPNNKVVIPVYIDLDHYENPLEERKEEIISEINLSKAGKDFFDSRSDQFIITPDSKTTRLLKTIKFGEIQRELNDRERFEIPKKNQWIPNKSGKKRCFSLLLGNHAENNDGLVKIHNLIFDFQIDANSTSNIVLNELSQHPSENFEEDSFLNTNDLFNLTVKHQDKEVPFTSTLECPNTFQSFFEYEISFRHDEIIDIPKDVCKVNCSISFDYEELLNEEIIGSGHFENIIVFNIEKNPGSYWLSVDYGTSACVAAFSDGDLLNKDEILIDLQSPLEERTPSEKYIESNIEEFDTKYLSSTITLKEGKDIENNEFGESLIHLSPTKEDTNYPIPYLKSLIGMESLPNFNGLFNNFQYKEGNLQVSFKDKPPKVEKVLKNSYYSLLNHFVEKGVHNMITTNDRKKSDLNKIILTIPNTFTPKHIAYIKEILSDSIFQHYKKDYITFLSESDAVACNYVYNWNVYNKEQDPNESEYVLVYDMGAGTLDLTYFKIQNEKSKKKKVKILGKLGKATAGNYLDYLIAQSVYDIHKEDFQDNPMNTGSERGSSLSNKKLFKNIVKNIIKPHLDEHGDYEIRAEGDHDTLLDYDLVGSYEEIRNSRLLHDFIRDNTDTLIENFFQLFTPEKGGFHRKGEVLLDTVIFTGRGMQFQSLKEELKGVLKDWSCTESINFIDDLDASSLKNIVVKGALQYALLYKNENSTIQLENKNLLARYGVLYNDPETGLWKYKNLLDPSTRPLKSTPIIKDGITIFEYDTDMYDADPSNNKRSNYIDMSNTVKAWFVQSYAKDTATDMNEGNTEYISKIEAIRRDAIDVDINKVMVRICIDSNNQMHLSVGEDILDPTEPLRVDLENSESFRKSMWPYL